MADTIHQDLAPNLAATVIVLGILAFATFGLRVHTRITRRAWGHEDSMMAFGTLPVLVLTISTAIGAWKGLGILDSTFALPGNQKFVETGFFWFFIYQVFYCTSIIPVKLSIALMLNRIAVGTQMKWFRYTNYGFMALCACSNLASALYIIFRCNPVRAAWDAALIAEGGHCQADVILQNIYWMDTSVNIFTDWVTAFMPIPLLWRVQMNMQTKISVGAILGLGIFASLSGCIRLVYTINLTSKEDYLYGVANILIWGYAEPAIGMIVGNIATLRPLLRRFVNFGGSDGRSGGNNKTPGRLGAYPGHPAYQYKSFDGPGAKSYEMSSSEGSKFGSGGTSTQIRSGGVEPPSFLFNDSKRPSSESDGDSQKQILNDVENGGLSTPARPAKTASSGSGIIVSRQIHVQSDRS